VSEDNGEEAMIKRCLSGLYFRSKVNGKWDNVTFEDLSEEEQRRVMENRSEEWLKSLAIQLAVRLRDIGDQFDILSE
jgi:hypothetical protein